MDQNIFYKLGKRDAVAQSLMLVRDKGERAALRELAQQLIASDKANPNPHAKWYLENHPPPDM